MTPVAAAILEGMPDPRLLHRADRDGTTWILAGSVVLACYPSGDAGMRNVAVAVCRQLGFGGRAVAEVMGLTENYVATLHNRALREGTAGLVRAAGRPRKLAAGAWEKAARWRAGGASDTEIITRHLLHLGGTITCTPRAITVTLDQPPAPRITRALRLLLNEINATPPRMPGDTRPITYQLAADPQV